MAVVIAALCLLLAGHALARHGSSQAHLNAKRQSGPGPGLAKKYPAHSITIPVDHFHNESRYEPHTNRTFQNDYWLDTSSYVDGGPVIVNALGEDSASFDFDWLEKGLLYALANATGGVSVLWGQRYYAGAYDIVPNYTTANLRFHSTEQALADLAYFATHARLPGLEHRDLTAPGTPWIVVGGSYAGAISAFTRIQYPHLFWGGISSSGITTAIADFWQAYDVVRRYGPRACIGMQQKLISIADTILLSGNKTQIAHFKAAFGAQTLTADHDFANLLSSPMGGWQGHSWVPGENYPFQGPGTFCANITSQAVLFPPSTTTTNLSRAAAARAIIADGGRANETRALLHPVLNWIGSIKSLYIDPCRTRPTLDACYSFDTPSPFDYMTCTEYGLFFTGYVPGAAGRPPALPVASRLLTADYARQHCRAVYNLTSPPDLHTYNRYGGFNLSYPRLALATGQVDVWRPAGPLAEETAFGVPNPRLRRPGGGGTSQPEIVIQGGGHEWDLAGVFPNQTTAKVPPPAVKMAHQREIGAVKAWLEEWRKEHPTTAAEKDGPKQGRMRN